jgi:hypothetical protein
MNIQIRNFLLSEILKYSGKVSPKNNIILKELEVLLHKTRITPEIGVYVTFKNDISDSFILVSKCPELLRNKKNELELSSSFSIDEEENFSHEDEASVQNLLTNYGLIKTFDTLSDALKLMTTMRETGKYKTPEKNSSFVREKFIKENWNTKSKLYKKFLSLLNGSLISQCIEEKDLVESQYELPYFIG